MGKSASWAKGPADTELKSRQADLESHHHDFAAYSLDWAGQRETDAAYEQVKGQVAGIQEKLRGRQSDRRDLEDLCRRAASEADAAKEAIARRNVPMEWLAEEERTVSHAELRKVDLDLKDTQAEAAACKETWWTARGYVSTCQELVSALAEGIQNSYGKNPYLSYDKAIHAEELHAFETGWNRCKVRCMGLWKSRTSFAWRLENQEAYDQILESSKDLVEAQWRQVSPLSWEVASIWAPAPGGGAPGARAAPSG